MKTSGISRKDFINGALASAGLGFLFNRRLFAVPAGWTPPSGTPDLVFGVISDTHFGPYREKGIGISKDALWYFKKNGVQAVMHCGDIADDGLVVQLKAFADAWNEVFPEGTAQPTKLVVTGNHDYYGGTADHRTQDKPYDYSMKLYNNLETGNSGVIGCVKDFIDPDFQDVWHKTVKGKSGKDYHFFGYGGAGDKNYNDPQKIAGKAMAELVAEEVNKPGWDANLPFFMLSHITPHSTVVSKLNKAIGDTLCSKVIKFEGHGHTTSSCWTNAIKWEDGANYPNLQCGLCGCKWAGGEQSYPIFAKGWGDGRATGCYLTPEGGYPKSPKHGFLVKVYAEAIVIHRIDVNNKTSKQINIELPSLGPDWVMALDSTSRDEHPLSIAALKEAIGTPEFPSGAGLGLEWERDSIKLTIPKADGNADSRIYGFNVEVSSDCGVLRKSVYATGYNVGMGFEPDNGVTTFRIDKGELPLGEKLSFRVWPCSSLGTRGKPLDSPAKCIRVSLETSVPNVGRDARFVLTHGANIDGQTTGVIADSRPPWVKDVCVEDGEIVVYTRTAADGATVRVK